jgi:hypothetical protein
MSTKTLRLESARNAWIKEDRLVIGVAFPRILVHAGAHRRLQAFLDLLRPLLARGSTLLVR